MKYPPKIYLLVVLGLIEDGLDLLSIYIRKRLCRVLGHKYPVIWFKKKNDIVPLDGQAGTADTEAGCVYCKTSHPNEHPMYVNNIDFNATKHRKSPPKHNVYNISTNQNSFTAN